MSYGFDDKTKDTESGSKFLKAGIQEGVFLKEVKFNPAKECAGFSFSKNWF